MNILCLVGLHFREHIFVPFGDQPFLTNRAEDELCVMEGKHLTVCRYCKKELKNDN
ncbi:hypothetical protein U8V72_25800 [Priestia filamentosa]|uniref:hypothetical protein n=1 Tax=Priestia filamentosa TaxID=1402861 RepID=UPI00397C8E36